MENEKTKQENLATLYSLRAGLSVLSEIADEAKEMQEKNFASKRNVIDRQIKQERAEIELKRLIERKSDFSEQYISGLKSTLEKSKEKKKALERKRSSVLVEKEKEDNWIKAIKILFIISLIGGLLLLPIYISHPEMDFDTNTLTGCITCIAGAMVIGGLCLNFFVIIIAWFRSDDRNVIKKELNTLDKDIKTENSTINQCQNELKGIETGKNTAYSKEMDSYQHSIDNTNDEIFECEQTIEEETASIEANNKVIKDAIAKFIPAHKAVQEQFSSFLDERDWGNVDLIIFNYETGRALDMRDALLQVDNERRNEQLVEAVSDASMSISASINRGFGALQSSMSKQFDMLDSRISSFSDQVSQISERSSRQTNALEQKLGQIASISSAQQALLNKMNTSSTQMAEDMNTLRKLAEENT